MQIEIILFSENSATVLAAYYVNKSAKFVVFL